VIFINRICMQACIWCF